MITLVTLNDTDRERAAQAGLARFLHYSPLPQRAYYKDRPRSIQADVRAAVAELAVANYLGLPWNQDADVDTSHLPDVGDFVEVRCVNVPDGDALLTVRRHEVEREAIIVWAHVHNDLTRVALIGAQHADVAWGMGTTPAWDTGGYSRQITSNDTFSVNVLLTGGVPADDWHVNEYGEYVAQ